MVYQRQGQEEPSLGASATPPPSEKRTKEVTKQWETKSLRALVESMCVWGASTGNSHKSCSVLSRTQDPIPVLAPAAPWT